MQGSAGESRRDHRTAEQGKAEQGRAWQSSAEQHIAQRRAKTAGAPEQQDEHSVPASGKLGLNLVPLETKIVCPATPITGLPSGRLRTTLPLSTQIHSSSLR